RLVGQHFVEIVFPVVDTGAEMPCLDDAAEAERQGGFRLEGRIADQADRNEGAVDTAERGLRVRDQRVLRRRAEGRADRSAQGEEWKRLPLGADLRVEGAAAVTAVVLVAGRGVDVDRVGDRQVQL